MTYRGLGWLCGIGAVALLSVMVWIAAALPTPSGPDIVDQRYQTCVAAGGTFHYDGNSTSFTCTIPTGG